MFNSNKSCFIVGFVTLLVYLVGQFFLVKLAKDEAIVIVACIAAAVVAAILIGKSARNLFADGGFLCKLGGGLMVGLFAVGTIAIVFLVILWF